MSAFDDWLDARDADTLRRAWDELAPSTLTLGPFGWAISELAAIRLASRVLGCPAQQLEWLASPDGEGAPPPIFEIERPVERCFLEHAADMRERCLEHWSVRELRAGTRGVQRVTVTWFIDDGTRDGLGGGGTVIRVFDRATAAGASLLASTRTVSPIGGLEVRDALDLLSATVSVRFPGWTTYDLAAMRAAFAQVALEVDAHFDRSAAWPAIVLERTSLDGVQIARTRFHEGAFAIACDENGGGNEGWAFLRCQGLPWGHALSLALGMKAAGADGHLTFRLPQALGERVVARLAALPGVALP